MTDEQKVPVLIVGGGPTGLSTALFLARLGVPVRLVERHASTAVHPRARGLNVRTMEIYRAVGLEEPILVAGAALSQSHYMLFVESLAGKEIRRVPEEDLMAGGELLAQYSPSHNCQCAQDELEPLLLEAARQAGAEISFNTELVSFEQTDDGLTARLLNRATGQAQTVQAQYLVAADGTQSQVRAELGIAMKGIPAAEGYGPLGCFINIYFRADLIELVKDRFFGICFVENPAVDGLFLPVNNSDRWLLNLSYSPQDGTTPADYTPTRCLELVRLAVGLPQLNVEILSILPWEGAALVADRMQVGRVFLAGDAAHQMPPAGAFGLNTGVQDAHNLAWKLAALVKGTADPTLLETYQTERLPIAQTVVEQAVRELQAPTPDTLVGADWQNSEAAQPDWSGGFAGGDEGGYQEPGLLDQLQVILGYRYQSAAVIAEAGEVIGQPGLNLNGRPGTRAPHVWLKRAGKAISTLDLFDGSFVLFAGVEGGAWVEAARRVAASRELDLKVYLVGDNGELSDPDHLWLSSYGLTASGAVLIRPDGFVGWRTAGQQLDPEQQLEAVLNTLLCLTAVPPEA